MEKLNGRSICLPHGFRVSVYSGGEDMEEFPVEGSCGWGLLTTQHQMENRTEVGIASKGSLLLTSTS